MTTHELVSAGEPGESVESKRKELLRRRLEREEPTGNRRAECFKLQILLLRNSSCENVLLENIVLKAELSLREKPHLATLETEQPS